MLLKNRTMATLSASSFAPIPRRSANVAPWKSWLEDLALNAPSKIACFAKWEMRIPVKSALINMTSFKLNLVTGLVFISVLNQKKLYVTVLHSP